MALSTNCWKYLVLTFNVLFAMSAVVLFGASGFLLYRLFIYRHFLGMSVEWPAILLLMMAIITCSIAWIGWRTTQSMHQIHIIITGILIVLVVVIEFSCFVWAMVVWDNVEIDIKRTMTSYFSTAVHSSEPSDVDAIRWDRLHVKFECCGVSGPNDYVATGHVPLSCCGQGPLDPVHKPYAADCSAIYQRGCGKPLHDYARDQLLLIAMTALAASILQACSKRGPPTGSSDLTCVVAFTIVSRNTECTERCERRRSLVLTMSSEMLETRVDDIYQSYSTGIFCTFFLAHSITERRRASIRNSTSIRESTFAAPDDSLLTSPTAPAPTLPKY